MKYLRPILAAAALTCGLLSTGLTQAAVRTVGPGALAGADLTWSTGDTVTLNGFCYVLNGTTLTIQPGVVVKGVPGTGLPNLDFGTLFICQGGQINAVGTRNQPIIFTVSSDDVTNPSDIAPYARGLWGGVVLLGNATINTAVDTTGNAATPVYEVYEGLPDTQISGQFVHRFGGSNDADSSGTLRYVSIRHGGKALAANKEINGLSMGGVGSGTEIEYIECYGTADDGYEWWGGTVNSKHLVSAFNDDESFDTDAGYRGQNQFWFAVQNKDKRDKLGENNGVVNDRVGAGNRAPFSNWQVRNATLIGAGRGTTGSGNDCERIRDFSQFQWYNSIWTHTANGQLTVDANCTPLIPAGGPGSGGLEVHGNLFWQTGTSDAGGSLFFAAPWDNRVQDPFLTGVSYLPDYGLDPRPQAGSPALTPWYTPPANAFYTAAPYVGAFGQNDYWMDGWTHLWERGFLDISLATSYNAGTDTTTVSCRSVTGVNYQFQSSSDGANWANVGAPIAGTGGTISTTVSPTPAKLIFRVTRG